MAYTQDDVDRLKKAIGSGARKVRFGSGDSAEETTFHSLDDMVKLLAMMEAEVTPSKAQPMRTVGHYHDGLHHRIAGDRWGGW